MYKFSSLMVFESYRHINLNPAGLLFSKLIQSFKLSFDYSLFFNQLADRSKKINWSVHHTTFAYNLPWLHDS